MEAEELIAASSPGYRPRRGIIEAISGIRERRVAAQDVQCSDLAAQAGREALHKASMQPSDVDALIFAAAGQDLIEPATANIVQEKLGTHCQVFDVKNACNSFLNGIQIGQAMIAGGDCETVLVTSGEICSRAAAWSVSDDDEFREKFPGYTMGDAGAAALLTRAVDDRGIFYLRFESISRHWRLATFPYGGSMHPRGDEYAYLRGDGATLRQAFVESGPPVLRRMMREAGFGFGDFKRILAHQVSVPYMRDMIRATGMPAELVEKTVVELGNTASASLPVAFVQAIDRGALVPGDKVMCLGIASGISIGLLMFHA